MLTIIFTVLLFMLAVAGMALGLIMRRKPLCGSCGNCSECILRRARS
jgi:hypothetical protein